MSARIVFHAPFISNPDALVALMTVVRDYWPNATVDFCGASEHEPVSVVLDGALFIDAMRP